MIEGTGGFQNVAKNLNKMISDTKKINPEILMKIGMDLESKASQLAPLDKGDLRASSFTEMMDNNKTVKVAFTERYALVMHEDLEYTPQEPGTGPKYLTNPLKQNESKYRNAIINAHKVR